MNKPHTAEQRLALSRMLIVTALREPAWMVLTQRWLKGHWRRATQERHSDAVKPSPSCGH